MKKCAQRANFRIGYVFSSSSSIGGYLSRSSHFFSHVSSIRDLHARKAINTQLLVLLEEKPGRRWLVEFKDESLASKTAQLTFAKLQILTAPVTSWALRFTQNSDFSDRKFWELYRTSQHLRISKVVRSVRSRLCVANELRRCMSLYISLSFARWKAIRF